MGPELPHKISLSTISNDKFVAFWTQLEEKKVKELNYNESKQD